MLEGRIIEEKTAATATHDTNKALDEVMVCMTLVSMVEMTIGISIICLSVTWVTHKSDHTDQLPPKRTKEREDLDQAWGAQVGP